MWVRTDAVACQTVSDYSGHVRHDVVRAHLVTKPQRREARRFSAEELKLLTEKIIGGAISVHRQLGPGLLESVYKTCLAYELKRSGLNVESEKPLTIRYGELVIKNAYRVDLLVARGVLVELKAIDKLAPIHEAQLLTYLRLSGCTVGLLINFNVPVLKDGLRRCVHGFPS